MSRQTEIYQIKEWKAIVSKQMSHLSQTQVKTLAMISFAMAACRYCGLTTVALFIAKLLSENYAAVYKRIREWHYDAQDKSGKQRCQIEIKQSFAPLMRWIMSLWKGKQLVLIMDATNLRDRFVILVISVAYRGFAIPVAWQVLAANKPGKWKWHWLTLLTLIKPAIPSDVQVFVMTDRGLYANWLFQYIKSLHWIPFMRINTCGYFKPDRSYYRLLTSFAHAPNSHWFGHGTAFKEHPVCCYLLAWWDAHAKEPWLILTSLAPDACDPGYYSLRSWIERGFRTTKRGGLGWHHSKMTDPARASRLWLSISLALLFLASLATDDDFELLTADFDDSCSPKRIFSVFRIGFISLLVSFIRGQDPFHFSLQPQPFPRFLFFDNS